MAESLALRSDDSTARAADLGYLSSSAKVLFSDVSSLATMWERCCALSVISMSKKLLDLTASSVLVAGMRYFWVKFPRKSMLPQKLFLGKLSMHKFPRKVFGKLHLTIGFYSSYLELITVSKVCSQIHHIA